MELILVFQVAGEVYGLEIHAIQEITEDPDIFYIPKAGNDFLGAINFHGDILPVLDLATILGFAVAKRDQRVIVLTPDHYSLVLAVTSVERIVEMPQDQILPRQEPEQEDYIRAVMELDGRIVNMLDLDRVLADYEQPSGEIGGEYGA